jgi:superfamily I DNA and/or RNA helicase
LIWQALVNAGLAERAGAWYRPQPDLMRDQNGAERNRLQVGTVDAFQGKQFDVAFLSVTRSSRPPRFEPGQAAPGHPGYPAYETWARRAYGHLMMRNRLCVAMSRQERLLVVAGDDAMFTSAATPAAVAPLREFYRLCAPPSSAGILLPAPGLTRMRR